jgi:hypothetical protein
MLPHLEPLKIKEILIKKVQVTQEKSTKIVVEDNKSLVK